MVTLGHFLLFYLPPLKTSKSKYWKMKKFPGEIIILHMCTKNHNIRCTVPEIQSETDIILPHFGQFFGLLPTPPLLTLTKTPGDIITLHTCTINDNPMMCGSWDMEHDRLNFVPFWTIFCPFTSPPPMDSENQNFQKLKKKLEDIIILHRCNINDNHIMYGSWDTKCNRQNFFVILGHFLPFYPPKNLKNQNFEKMKTTSGGIIFLHMCIINNNHMMYGSWDMEHDGHNFLSF